MTLQSKLSPALLFLLCQAVASAQSSQKAFATPELAAQALIDAAGKYDVTALMEILGPDGKDLVTTEDPVEDKNRAIAAAEMAREKHLVTIDPKNSARAELSVGSNDWPVPIPIVKRGGQWMFDTKAGRQEVLIRRIGENELNAISICRG